MTDDDGRFVSGLARRTSPSTRTAKQQEVTHFSNERVPVSLGIVLDTSGSMTPEKMSAARAAIDRFIYDLLGTDDELFFMQFANRPRHDPGVDHATGGRSAAPSARVGPAGGTAMYDAIADALPVAAAGQEPQEGAARHLRRQRHQQRDVASASCGR